MICKHDGFSGHVETHGKGFGCKEDFDETFAKEDFDDFFEDVEESGVVDADSALEEWQDFLDLREVAVVFGERVKGVGVDVSHEIFFVLWIVSIMDSLNLGGVLSLKSSLLILSARCSHSFLLKLKTMTGL